MNKKKLKYNLILKVIKCVLQFNSLDKLELKVDDLCKKYISNADKVFIFNCFSFAHHLQECLLYFDCFEKSIEDYKE